MESQIKESQQVESVNGFEHLDDYFFDENGSPYNQKQPFNNKIASYKSQNRHQVPSLACRQELNMNAFEQSSKKYNQIPLFYKLSLEFSHQEDNPASSARQKKNKSKNMQNDTKNIPKNFGKGIINFIQKNDKKAKRLVVQNGLSFFEFMKMIRHEKKTINTIADLRRLWTHQKFGRVIRILSNLFFREYSLEYIFNSRITSFSTHIKYRHILWSALKNPRNFNHIKQY